MGGFSDHVANYLLFMGGVLAKAQQEFTDLQVRSGAVNASDIPIPESDSEPESDSGVGVEATTTLDDDRPRLQCHAEEPL